MALPAGVIALLNALPRDLRDSVAGDLAEEYGAFAPRAGRLRASVWIWWTALRLVCLFQRERLTRGRRLPPVPEEIRGRMSIWDSVRQDVVFGARMLRRQPGFTFVAVITLAIGIGANTAIFSIVDRVLWRPLPFQDPGSLVVQRTRSDRRAEQRKLPGFAISASLPHPAAYAARLANLFTKVSEAGSAHPGKMRDLRRPVRERFMTI